MKLIFVCNIVFVFGHPIFKPVLFAQIGPEAVEEFQKHGVIAVVGDESYASSLGFLRKFAEERSFSDCDENVVKTFLPDSNVSRFSVGIKDGDDSPFQKCMNVSEAATAVKNTFTRTVSLFAKEIDEFYESSKMEEVLLDKQTLTHFHAYVNDFAGEINRELVPFHVDQGIILALSPTHDNALKIKIAGETYTVDADEGSFLLMAGRGLKDFLGFSDFDAADHGVFGFEEPVRTVVAQMLLPHRSRPRLDGVKFEDFFVETFNHNEQWRQLHEHECSADERMCWMRCMSKPTNCSLQDALCISKSTDDTCIEGVNHDCSLICPGNHIEAATTTTLPNFSGRKMSVFFMSTLSFIAVFLIL